MLRANSLRRYLSEARFRIFHLRCLTSCLTYPRHLKPQPLVFTKSTTLLADAAMVKTKKWKRTQQPSTRAEEVIPQSVTELEQEFSTIIQNIGKSQDKRSKATKKLIRTAIENAIDTSLSNDAISHLSTKKGKKAFKDIILDEIGTRLSDELVPSLSQADFVALNRPFKDLTQKLQILYSVPTQSGQHSEEMTVDAQTTQGAGSSLSDQVARLSMDHEPLNTFDDRSLHQNKKISTRAAQPVTRLEDSQDLNPDEDKDEDKDKDSHDCKMGIEIEVKEEQSGETKAMTLPDPAGFAISLAPTTANGHRFAVLFDNERVLEALASISAREIWQLVCDALHNYDPHIPNRSLACPWITHVEQLSDGCLVLEAKSENDVHIVTTNVQWIREIRDGISGGIETYKVVLKDCKTWIGETEHVKDVAIFIEKVREENSAAIPSLNMIGAIRDVMLLREHVPNIEGKDIAQYILVFGSREAANAALKMGLSFHNTRLECVIYSPGTQWHQQCSNCQSHNHTAKKCQSTPICGNCASRHLTKHCVFAKLRCANCHGKHRASSKTCPQWLEAEEKAHRSYRFGAEDSTPRTQAAAENPAAATLPPLALPPLVNRTQEETLDETPARCQLSSAPEIALTSSSPPQCTRKHRGNRKPASIKRSHRSTSSRNASSALLQTIDAFRAFVATRETLHAQDPTHNATKNPTSKKRELLESGHENEYMMAGALQVDGQERKRLRRERGKEKKEKKKKKEKEGHVRPLGHEDYVPPSLERG